MVNSLEAELIQSLLRSKNATCFRCGQHGILEIDRIRDEFREQYGHLRLMLSLFNVVAIISGMYGTYCVTNTNQLSPGKRVLVLEA